MLRKPITAGAALALLLAITACSSESPNDSADGKSSMPASSEDMQGEQYGDIIKTLRDAGFTTIEEVPLGDLMTGWLKSPGEVKEVQVGGKSSFEEGDTFLATDPIIISYHSFDEESESTESPSPATSSTSANVLTIENNEDFASLLNGPVSGPSVQGFVNKYQGSVIQLDGHITFLIDSDRAVYSTATIVAGNPGSPGTGPFFEITPSLLPANSPLQQKTLSEGQSVRLTAAIGHFYTFEQSSTFVPERDSRVVLSVTEGLIEPR